MKTEIQSAGDFLTNLLRSSNRLNSTQLATFNRTLCRILQNHYQDHWFPEKPFKGSGYRCMRINHKMDPLIAKAGTNCGLKVNELFRMFPNELTIWVDPEEVSYRIGENGSVGVLLPSETSSEEEEESQPEREEVAPVSRSSQQSNQQSSYSSSNIHNQDVLSSCKDEVLKYTAKYMLQNGQPESLNIEYLATLVSS